MTTSFVAATAASGTGAAATSFQAPGAAAPEAEQSTDTTVVFEHNGRKFTKSDLAKKLESADQFIEQLKTEGAENRKALDAATQVLKEQINAVELLKKIKDGQQSSADGGQSGTQQTQQPPVTVEAVVQRIKDDQAKATTEAQRNANWNDVTTTLTKAFGTAVDQKVAQVAAEKSLTLEQAAEMARATPKAFLALFPDLSKKVGSSALPPSGKVNTQAFVRTEQRGTSGYTKAQGTRELVSIYQQRLAEVAE